MIWMISSNNLNPSDLLTFTTLCHIFKDIHRYGIFLINVIWTGSFELNHRELIAQKPIGIQIL
jgi:hypothetical protein